jgi:hypothetical protein
LPFENSAQPQLGQMEMEPFEFQMIANFLFEQKSIGIVFDE